MRIACLQENLNRGLGIVGRAVATRTTLPITGFVLLAADQGRLKLAATNLEIGISYWLGAEVEEEGSIAVPAGLLTNFVGSLPLERIDLHLPPGSLTLELRCARYEARIKGQSASEFPPIPQIEEGISTQIDPKLLRLAINRVVFAAATEDSRPVLTGVHAHFSGGAVTLAAADGFRLAVDQVALEKEVAEDTSIIIPARTLRELDRFLRDQEEPVEVMINPQRSQIFFRLENLELVSQLLQGTYPNYKQLIPQSYNTRALIPVPEFLRATRTASVFARDGGGIIRLIIAPGGELTPGKITLTARAEEMGDNVSELDAQVTGEETKIAFNSRYLLDVLGVLEEEQVALETTGPSSPGVFRPIGGGNWVHVVMPMFVQW